MIASIDRYQISRELGRGGMAVVYLGYDPRIGREVAVKVMSSTLPEDPIYRKRFNREVNAVAALEHPNIVPIYDYGLYDKQPFLVMRYMAGGTLAARLADGPLTLVETVEIMRRIGAALDEAHRRGIIHRDLKPPNILRDQYGTAFLSDFGVVKNVDAKTTPTDPVSLTGTPSYMSPEQVQGKPLDGRSDIYSVGAMLFELLSGQKPSIADGGVAVALKHLTEPVPNILDLNPNLPAEIDRIILRAMAKSPEERYPTVGLLVRDLATAAGETVSALDVNPAAAPRVLEPSANLDSPVTMPLDGSVVSDVQKPAQSAPLAPFSMLRRVPVLASLLGILAVCGVAVFALPGWRMVNGSSKAATPTADSAGASVNLMMGGGTGKIAFVSDVAGVPDFFLLDVSSKSVTRLITNITPKSDPAWSPDGQSILFLSQAGDQHIMYAVQADGTHAVPLLQEAALSYSPAWSPDGTKIVFASKRGSNPDIYVMNADGSDILRLTSGTFQNWKPSWSPDGKHIIFYSGRDGNYNIYRMNADGSNQIALTDNTAQDYDPAWSPDGKKIAFVSERDGNAEIYVMDADGTDQTRLTRNDSADTSPVWSPDGSLIAFVSHRDKKAEIYVMGSNGSNQLKLTDGTEDNLSPVWQPPDMKR